MRPPRFRPLHTYAHACLSANLECRARRLSGQSRRMKLAPSRSTSHSARAFRINWPARIYTATLWDCQQACAAKRSGRCLRADLECREKKVVRTEQADEARPKQEQPEMDRYLLQVDRQTKRSFKTAEAARSAALEIKTRFPALQVSIYDGSSKSRTVVGLPGSAS
jgi:hypothetical protein